MITKQPTDVMLEEWKSIWIQYKGKLKPNRQSGDAILDYLQNTYVVK